MTDQMEMREMAGDSGNALLSGLRRVLMAGVGAVALTQEQMEEFVGKLVERGEIADGDARFRDLDLHGLEQRPGIGHCLFGGRLAGRFSPLARMPTVSLIQSRLPGGRVSGGGEKREKSVSKRE